MQSGYFQRLMSTMIVVIVLLLVSICEYLQMTYIYHSDNRDIMQVIASSAYMDLLLVSFFVSAYALRQLYSIIVGIRSSSYGIALQDAANPSDSTAASRDTATRIVCLATPADCEGLAFRDKCRLYRVQAEQDQKPTPPVVIYMTPSMLWYNIYTISTAIFVVGYAVHGGHATASAVFAVSTTACAIGYSIVEARRVNVVQIACRVVSGIFLTTSVILVAISLQAGVAPLLDPVPISTTRVIENMWLAQILPALAPVALVICRFNADQKHVTNLSAPTVVSVALPFICALSVCYLSVYTPLHAAWIDARLDLVSEWLRGNTTSLQLLEGDPIPREGFYVVAMWIVGPALTWSLYVAVVAGFLRIYKMQGCAAAIVFTLAVRQHTFYVQDSISIAAIVLSTLCLFVTPCISPPPVHSGTDSIAQQLDVWFTGLR